MNAENQHLDFLISQYVDGFLEGADRKSVEQKLLTDPEARKLFAGHREVQDILDDFGNRIPLIDWDEFGKKLEARLEAEAREKQWGSMFRRRMRAVAAAAALLIAVGLGYAWHAVSSRTVEQTPGNVAVTPGVAPAGHDAVMPESATANDGGAAVAKVAEPGGSDPAGGTGAGIDSGAPADQVAYQALAMSVQYGFGRLLGNAAPQSMPARGTEVSAPGPAREMEDGGTLQ